MDVAARLIAFKELTGLSNSQFADKAGIPRPTLSQFLNGRNKRLSDDLTAKLHSAFPSLNVLWLLFGEGEMVVDGNIEFSEGKNGDNQNLFSAQLSDNQTSEGNENTFENSAQVEPIQKEGNDNTGFGRQESEKVFSGQSAKPLQPTLHVPSDPTKHIQSIMVFYSDNSFEIFTPSK